MYEERIEKYKKEVKELASSSPAPNTVAKTERDKDSKTAIRYLEEENAQLKHIVDTLKAEIDQISPLNQSSTRNRESAIGPTLMKSISFSKEAASSQEERRISMHSEIAERSVRERNNSQQSELGSRIKIEVLDNPAKDRASLQNRHIKPRSDTEIIERLTNLVSEYTDKLAAQEKEIVALIKGTHPYEDHRVSSGPKRDFSQQQDINVYISSILRKLSIAEEQLSKERI